jgi:fused signal recognition particle receptor
MFSILGKKEKEAEKSAPGLLERLKQSVTKTRTQFAERVQELFSGAKEIDPKTLAKLETALLAADIGVKTTKEVLAAVQDKLDRHALANAEELRAELKRQILARLALPTPGTAGTAAASMGNGNAAANQVAATADVKPRVIFMVGVNGVGKTTTMGKLAHRLQKEGHTVLLCAADTFRAAAIEQLEVWARRAGVEIVKTKPGGDPAAVVYDALAAAKSRGTDAVIVDTAGRLHTKSNLMNELEKMKRTAAKVVAGAPHELLLVMDATTGQNGLVQAREFTSSVGITGIVLTKLDGTAKGGIVVAITRELGLPVRYVGVGEQIEDLLPFDAKEFVDSIFD